MDSHDLALIRHARKVARQSPPPKKHSRPLKPVSEMASMTALASMSRKFLKVALF